MSQDLIRLERPDDAAAVRAVLLQAFPGEGEADLVEALRAAGAVTLALVAEDPQGQVVGQVLFSPVTIEREGGGEPQVAQGLAPLAVLPERQRQGLGCRLTETGLRLLRAGGHTALVVLGDPAYHARFGFQPAERFGLRWEYGAPPGAFQALELSEGALAGAPGVVRYRPEFGGL